MAFTFDSNSCNLLPGASLTADPYKWLLSFSLERMVDSPPYLMGVPSELVKVVLLLLRVLPFQGLRSVLESRLGGRKGESLMELKDLRRMFCCFFLKKANRMWMASQSQSQWRIEASVVGSGSKRTSFWRKRAERLACILLRMVGRACLKLICMVSFTIIFNNRIRCIARIDHHVQSF